ncbi:hypothetical protein ISN44_As12g030620 [Arabidopsis suecica]|uniref:Uncharacterized protein n=1 Tax=Arabidopsis suecica TaxID=45249 RepID=A0A8T1YNM7_ARASU|nr:hypothetical protein ISN44_As12g030620 [Arabidopsis suecica]
MATALPLLLCLQLHCLRCLPLHRLWCLLLCSELFFPAISLVATPPLNLEDMRISQARGTRKYWEEKRFWIEKDHEKDHFDKDDQFVKPTWTDDEIEDCAFGVEKDAQVEEWDLEAKLSFWKQHNLEAFLSAKIIMD